MNSLVEYTDVVIFVGFRRTFPWQYVIKHLVYALAVCISSYDALWKFGEHSRS